MNERVVPFEAKMQKSVDALAEAFTTIRAGRANPHVLDKLRVDYYGTPSAIQAVANVSVPEARIIQIQPWEAKMIKEIEKAILASDLGINPSNDGRIIRLVFPALTEERRKQISKEVAQLAEDAKVGVRNIRRDCIDKIKAMKKNSEITEDDQKYAEEKIQKITDEFVKKVDEIAEAKTKEIMEI